MGLLGKPTILGNAYIAADSSYKKGAPNKGKPFLFDAVGSSHVMAFRGKAAFAVKKTSEE